MQVPRRILVTCLAGVVGISALPSGTAALASYTGNPAGAVATASTGRATLAASLQQLRAEVNARWPGRSTASDGWLGDGYHQQRRSDHNPVGTTRGPKVGTPGSVHALDITSKGIDPSALVGAVIGDSRLWYVIYNKTIWSRTNNWIPRAYYGDPHTTHVHFSLRDDGQAIAQSAERDTRPWLGKLSSVSTSLNAAQVKALQQALIKRGFAIPAGATGTFGSQTKAAVAAFQRAQGWSGSGADGIPGKVTLARLGLSTAPAPAVAKAAPAKAVPVAASTAAYLPGTRGAHIVALQKALISRGFSIPSGATGLFGNETKAAVAAFQRSRGWSGSGADGVPGAKTVAALGLASGGAATVRTVAAVRTVATTTSAAYVPGARGAHIVALQKALIARGMSIPSGPTGLYGNETKRAVAAFQRAQGWTGSLADGVPGKVTLTRLGIA